MKNNSILKIIITAALLIILVVLAIKAIQILFPVAIVVIAGYIIYLLVTNIRRKQG